MPKSESHPDWVKSAKEEQPEDGKTVVVEGRRVKATCINGHSYTRESIRWLNSGSYACRICDTERHALNRQNAGDTGLRGVALELGVEDNEAIRRLVRFREWIIDITRGAYWIDDTEKRDQHYQVFGDADIWQWLAWHGLNAPGDPADRPV